MFCDGAKGRGLYNRLARGCYLRIHHDVPCAIPTVGQAAVVRSGSPAAHTDIMGASAIKCWQNDTKTLQCIKLQPWSFKRAEFWHRTGKRRHSLRGTGQFHTVNMVKELDLTAEAGDVLGDPRRVQKHKRTQDRLAGTFRNRRIYA